MKDFFTEADAMFPCMDEHKAEHGYRSYVSMVKVITLEKANRLLRERGKVVYLYEDERYWCPPNAPDYEVDESKFDKKALIINIEPIEQDTAESLLKEFIRKWDDPLKESWLPIIERAKKLLEKK